MDATQSEKALANAPAHVRYVSLAIAVAVAASTVFYKVTSVGATHAQSKFPKSYLPLTWVARCKLTWEQVRAAAPPATSPCAVAFWAASWLAYAVVVFYSARVVAWCAMVFLTMLNTLWQVTKIATIAHHSPSSHSGVRWGGDGGSPCPNMDTDMHGGSAMANIISKTMANVAPKLVGKLDTGMVRNMVTHAVGSEMSPSMITKGMHMLSKDGVLMPSIRLITKPITSIGVTAKAAARKDSLRFLKCAAMCTPVFMGGVMTVAVPRIFAARDARSMDFHPLDALVCDDSRS